MHLYTLLGLWDPVPCNFFGGYPVALVRWVRLELVGDPGVHMSGHYVISCVKLEPRIAMVNTMVR